MRKMSICRKAQLQGTEGSIHLLGINRWPQTRQRYNSSGRNINTPSYRTVEHDYVQTNRCNDWDGSKLPSSEKQNTYRILRHIVKAKTEMQQYIYTEKANHIEELCVSHSYPVLNHYPLGRSHEARTILSQIRFIDWICKSYDCVRPTSFGGDERSCKNCTSAELTSLIPKTAKKTPE